MFEEAQPIALKHFKGLFNRGDELTVPQDYFSDCLNTITEFGSVGTRQGFTREIEISGVLRYVLYKRINEATRFIILDSNHQLWDSTLPATPIHTFGISVIDFSAVNFNNRIYISPHNGTVGAPNEFIYVYDGTTFRKAGGIAPTGALGVVEGAAGNVEAGSHLFGVAFRTTSGFLTPAGPATFPRIVASGTKKLNFSGIPIGPAGTSARVLIGTRAIQNYNGNQLGYEYFLIPNGVIENNVDTTLNDVNFFDADLQDDASYLFDELAEIPAGLVLSSYKGRMIVANFDGDQSLARISKANDPESFDSVDGICVIDATEAGGITNAVEYRDLVGFTKNLRSYVTNDNGDEPSTWDVQSWDKGVGTGVHGISTILDAKGVNTDKFFIADRSGLLIFDGIFQKPELTWAIKDTWARINKLYFHTIEVANDPINSRIYVAVPLDSAVTPNFMLVADYSEGLTYDAIKWHLWQFPWYPTTIVVDVENNVPVFKIGSMNNNIYQMDASVKDDFGSSIDSYIKSAFLPGTNDGQVNTFVAFKSRVIGNGSLISRSYTEDNIIVTSYPGITLNTSPGREYSRGLNVVNERMALRLRTSNFNEWFKVTSIILYYAPTWSGRYGD